MRTPSTHESMSALKRVSLFASLDESALSSLAAQCRYRVFAAGEPLFREGDDGHTLYVLLSGRVSVQRDTEGGRTICLASRGPGDHFGELSLLDGQPRSADVVTVERCEVLTLSRQPFLEWLERSPAVARNLLVTLARRLRESADDAATQRTHDVMGRLCAHLLELMDADGERDADGRVRIRRRLPQQALADRVGADRATVNRKLSALRQVRAIELNDGRVVILDAARLRRFAEG